MSDRRPVGFLDSGAAGLAVLREVTRRLPDESTVFLADTGRSRFADPLRCAVEGVETLVASDVKAVALLDPTMAAVALPTVRRRFGVPTVGLLEPTAAAAALATRVRRIGVIAPAPAMLEAAWTLAIRSVNPAILVTEVALPDDAEADSVAALVERFEGVDTIVLGSLALAALHPRIQARAGERVAVLHPLQPTSAAIIDLLIANGREAPGMSRGTAADAGAAGHEPPPTRTTGSPRRSLIATGNRAAFRADAAAALGRDPDEVAPRPDGWTARLRTGPVRATDPGEVAARPDRRPAPLAGPLAPRRRARGSVIVIGAGVIGLSTAVEALRRGYDVRVIAAEGPSDTTSARSAASFKPHDVAVNDLAYDTLARSWEAFARIEAAGDEARTGVRMHTHWEASSSVLRRPWYADVVRDSRDVAFPDVPGGYVNGWAYETFFVDMARYLDWLASEVGRLGGSIDIGGRLRSRDEVADLPADLVFNCTGMGARELFGDEAMEPVKGHIVVVPARPWMTWSISADGFYVYPRARETVLGGTVERGEADDAVDPTAVGLILRGNRRILPELDASDVLRSYAGIRPYRAGSIRIERDPDLPNVIHNYGHGGAGVTLSWGSAERALDLA